MRKAIIVENNEGLQEARCANCGKLLFTIKKCKKNGKIGVDKLNTNVIMVSRCTRNSCKTDNEVSVSL